jgi:hypothetical protein
MKKLRNEATGRRLCSRFQTPRPPRLRVKTKSTKRTHRRSAAPSFKFRSAYDFPDFAPLRLCVRLSESIYVASVALELPNEPMRLGRRRKGERVMGRKGAGAMSDFYQTNPSHRLALCLSVSASRRESHARVRMGVFAKRTQALGASFKVVLSASSASLREHENYETNPPSLDRRFQDLRSQIVPKGWISKIICGTRVIRGQMRIAKRTHALDAPVQGFEFKVQSLENAKRSQMYRLAAPLGGFASLREVLQIRRPTRNSKPETRNRIENYQTNPFMKIDRRQRAPPPG